MLIVCDICDEVVSELPHVCDKEKIKAYIKSLQDRANKAERNLEDVQNAVFMILKDLPELQGESISVKTEWLRNLWSTAKCQWYEQKSADDFLVCWLATHRILCEAFDLFRSKNIDKEKKLRDLKDACIQASRILQYNENFDLGPEDYA